MCHWDLEVNPTDKKRDSRVLVHCQIGNCRMPQDIFQSLRHFSSEFVQLRKSRELEEEYLFTLCEKSKNRLKTAGLFWEKKKKKSSRSEAKSLRLNYSQFAAEAGFLRRHRAIYMQKVLQCTLQFTSNQYGLVCKLCSHLWIRAVPASSESNYLRIVVRDLCCVEDKLYVTHSLNILHVIGGIRNTRRQEVHSFLFSTWLLKLVCLVFSSSLSWRKEVWMLYNSETVTLFWLVIKTYSVTSRRKRHK